MLPRLPLGRQVRAGSLVERTIVNCPVQADQGRPQLLKDQEQAGFLNEWIPDTERTSFHNLITKARRR